MAGRMGIRSYGGCIVQSGLSTFPEPECRWFLYKATLAVCSGGGEVPVLSFQDCVLTTPPWFSILGLTRGIFVLRLAVWEGQAV